MQQCADRLKKMDELLHEWNTAQATQHRLEQMTLKSDNSLLKDTGTMKFSLNQERGAHVFGRMAK